MPVSWLTDLPRTLAVLLALAGVAGLPLAVEAQQQDQPRRQQTQPQKPPAKPRQPAAGTPKPATPPVA